MNVKKLAAAAIASAVLAACSANDGANAIPSDGPAQRARAAAAVPYGFAPYVDMMAYPPFSFARGSSQTGTRYYTMAFLVSRGNTECRGAWGGIELPAGAPYVKAQLAAIRARGGDGILSFGGAGHKELAQTCADAASLAAAYEYDIDYYGITHVDFDIEGAAVDDLPSVERRSQALAAVRAHYAQLGRALVISYTLPVDTTGMPGDVLAVLESALAAGTTVDLVNLMTMDFGNSAAPNPAGHMAGYAIASMESAAKQLRRIGFPLGSNPYASMGVTPMIGVNDVAGEIFEPADATKLLAWAQSNGVGRIAFWAAQRDEECKGGVQRYASDICSGIVQKTGAFDRIFAAY